MTRKHLGKIFGHSWHLIKCERYSAKELLGGRRMIPTVLSDSSRPVNKSSTTKINGQKCALGTVVKSRQNK